MSGGTPGLGIFAPPLHAGRLVVRQGGEPRGELACFSCPDVLKNGGDISPRQFREERPGGLCYGSGNPNRVHTHIVDRAEIACVKLSVSGRNDFTMQSCRLVFSFTNEASYGDCAREKRGVNAARMGAAKSGQVLAGNSSRTKRPARTPAGGGNRRSGCSEARVARRPLPCMPSLPPPVGHQAAAPRRSTERIRCSLAASPACDSSRTVAPHFRRSMAGQYSPGMKLLRAHCFTRSCTGSTGRPSSGASALAKAVGPPP